MDKFLLESILIDSKNGKYEINGNDISNCTSLSITFIDGEWSVATQNKYYGKRKVR